MLTTQIHGLYVAETSNKGRGVFTTADISSQSVIEICPCIILTNKDTLQIHKTLLHDYYFLWDLEEKTSAIALGFGSIYNHSELPNADFLINRDANDITFVAIKDIQAGEEILINYIGLKDTEAKLWF